MKKLYSNIELIAVPSQESHLVNVKYVKDLMSRRIKESVRLVSLENIEATYDSTDKTLTEINGSALKVDGISVEVSDRVLIAGQLDQSTNGIYTVETVGTDGIPASASSSLGGSNTGLTDSSLVTFTEADFLTNNSASVTLTYSGTDWETPVGTPITLSDYGIVLDGSASPSASDTIEITYVAPVGGTQTVLKRAEDFDESSKITPNVIIPVSQGSGNSDVLFMLVNDGAITLDSDALVFAKYSSNDGAVTKYVGIFKGDGVTNSWTIQHAKADKAIVVSFYDEQGNPCGFDYKLTSENVITVSSDVTLEDTDGEFTVIVLA